MAGTIDVGTLSGTVELEDRLSAEVDKISKKVDELGGFFGKMSESVFSGEAALDAFKEVVSFAKEKLVELGEKIVDITIEGAKINDVTGNFDRMTAAVGRSGDEIVAKMRTALAGTVDDFTLVKVAARDFAAGLKLTDDQYELVATAARDLSKATGVDVKDALESVNQALVTGQTRGVKSLTGYIDLTSAEEQFAAKIGTTVDKLSEEGKAQAIRETILNRLSDATQRIGDQELDLGERVEQVKAKWQNFQDQLGVSIATSPVIIAAFDGIGQELANVFGSNQEDRIRTITKVIENIAIIAVEVGKVLVDAAIAGDVAWTSLKVAFLLGEIAIKAVALAIEAVLYGFMQLTQFASRVDLSGPMNALAADMRRLKNDIVDEGGAVYKATQDLDSFGKKGDELKAGLDRVAQKMREAQQQTEAHAEANKKAAVAVDTANKSIDTQNGLVKQSTEDIKAVDSAIDKLTGKSKDVDTYEKALEQMAAKGMQASAEQLQELGKQTDKWLLSGQKLGPMLDDLHAKWVQQNDILTRVGGPTLDAMLKKLPNLLGQVKQNGDAEVRLTEASRVFNDMILKSGSVLDELNKGALKRTKAGLDELGERAKAAGFTTTAAILQSHDDAVRLFNDMVASGRFSEDELRKAWDQLHPQVAAMLDRIGQLFTVANLKGLIVDPHQTAVDMLKEAWSGFESYFNQLLQRLLNKFIDWVIGIGTRAMGLSGSLGNILGGVTNGGIPGVGSLFGSGASAAAPYVVTTPAAGFGGAAAAGSGETAAATGGSALAGAAELAGAIAAPFVTQYLMDKYGKPTGDPEQAAIDAQARVDAAYQAIIDQGGDPNEGENNYTLLKGQFGDLNNVPTMDEPLNYVTMPGLVRVNPGDVVGMPGLTPGLKMGFPDAGPIEGPIMSWADNPTTPIDKMQSNLDNGFTIVAQTFDRGWNTLDNSQQDVALAIKEETRNQDLLNQRLADALNASQGAQTAAVQLIEEQMQETNARLMDLSAKADAVASAEPIASAPASEHVIGGNVNSSVQLTFHNPVFQSEHHMDLLVDKVVQRIPEELQARRGSFT